MDSVIGKENIICGSCGFKFERNSEFKHCSNCFACTGCEVYYCPECDNEIIVTPVRTIERKNPITDRNRD